MKHSSCVIFDMDGVLVDTEPIYISIDKSIFQKLSIDMSTEKHHGYIGISSKRMWGEIKSEFNIPASIDDLIKGEKSARISAICHLPTLKPIPGIIELLDMLHDANIPCAVASSSPRKLIYLILTKSNLISYFRCIVSGEDVVNGKPAPDIFIMVARELKIEPSSCLVIDDSPHGIKGAKEAGMATCGFINPSSGFQDLSAADLTVVDFGVTSRMAITRMTHCRQLWLCKKERLRI